MTLRPVEGKAVIRLSVVPSFDRDIALIGDGVRSGIRDCITGKSGWPLYLHGPAGTGKTCAALALIDWVNGGEYWTANGLCSALIQSQNGRLEWTHEGRGGAIWPEGFWRRMALTPLVVLDELGGRDRVSDHHYETVKTMFDVRHGKPLVVTSNLDIVRIETIYDDRVASRLSAGTVVKLDGKDRRLSHHKQQ